MNKYAIFISDGSFNGKSFEGWEFAEDDFDINLERYYECECEADCDECKRCHDYEGDDCPLEGACNDFIECTCEAWTVKVNNDITHYDENCDKFYTEKEWNQKCLDELIHDVLRINARITHSEVAILKHKTKIYKAREERSQKIVEICKEHELNAMEVAAEIERRRVK